MKRKEQSLIKGVSGYLQPFENQGYLMFERHNTGAVIKEYINKRGERKQYYYSYGKLGSSDFVIYFKGGRTIFLECKREGGKLSDAQVLFRIKAHKLGYRVEVVTDMNEVIKLVEKEVRQFFTQFDPTK